MLGRCTLCSSGNLITSRRSLGTRRRSRQSSISTRRTLAVHTGRPTTGTALRPTTGCWSCATGCRIRRKRRCYFALLPCHFFCVMVLSSYRHAEILLQSHSYPPLCSGVVQEAMGTYKGLHTALEHYILNTYNEWKDGVCSACVICARHFKHPARPVWVKSQNENDTFRSYLHSLVSPQECRTTSPRCWRSTS